MGPRDRDQFADLLDGALKQYGNVEPRAELEGKVLARLAPTRAPEMVRWPMAAAGPVAVAMIVLVGLMVRARPSGSGSIPSQGGRIVSLSRETRSIPVPAGRMQTEHRSRPVPVANVAEQPRAKQFPSPRAMSRQELMLIEYVQRYPEEALLVVKQQNEFQQGIDDAQKEIAEMLRSDQ